jgi:hypothetical protein
VVHHHQHIKIVIIFHHKSLHILLCPTSHNNKRISTSPFENMNLSRNSIIRGRRTRYTSMKFLLACLVVVLGHGIGAFQLSMVASRAPFGPPTTTGPTSSPRSNQYTANRRQPTTVNKPTSSNSVTSTLISNLACMALKRRLKDQTHVSCDLTADSNSLFLGRVGPVTVKGRSWQSSLGLTCRAIEATVDECRLDMGRIITNQKLVLTKPGTLREDGGIL